MTAFNISKTNDFGSSIFFKANCDCGTDEHNHTLIVEIDPDVDVITADLYQTLYWDKEYSNSNLLWRVVDRLSAALGILFSGRLRAEGHFIFSDQGIQDYANALLEARKQLLSRRASGTKSESET